MISTIQYKIDIRERNKIADNVLRQNDKKTNVIEVSLYDRGNEINLDETSVSFIFLNSNKEIIRQTYNDPENTIKVNGNTTSCKLNDEVLKTSGRLQFEVKVEEADTLFTTPRINLTVIKNIQE